MAAEQVLSLGVASATSGGVDRNADAAADSYFLAGLCFATDGQRDKALTCVELLRELRTASSALLADDLSVALSGSPSGRTKPR
jgi:hypothetical protein